MILAGLIHSPFYFQLTLPQRLALITRLCSGWPRR
jgi:hypothetical protein